MKRIRIPSLITASVCAVLTASAQDSTRPADGAGGNWTVRIYTSTNDDVSSSDNLSGAGSIDWNLPAPGPARVSLQPSVIPISAPPGDYRFGVGFDPATDGNSSNDSANGRDADALTGTAPPPPPNDACASANVIDSVPFDPPLLDTTTATGGQDDPLQVCSFGGPGRNSNTVWYRFTLPCEGTIEVDTCNSNFDTVLSVYTGFCGSLTEIACDDDLGCGQDFQSAITGLVVDGGQDLYIEVSDYAAPSGGNLDFHFDFAGPLPANDGCDSAYWVDLPSSVGGTTYCAMVDIAAPSCGTATVTSPGVWYKVRGTGSTMTATTCSEGTTYDTKISVFCNDCDTLTCVDGNDDDCTAHSSLLSTVTWCSKSGAEYLVLVQGSGNQTGPFALDIYTDDVPCTDAVECGGRSIGACCRGGECTGVMEQAECLEADGNWHEAQDCQTFACPEPLPACCLLDGSCALIPPTACQESDGTPLEPGSTCEGDCNENGIDDACEIPGDLDVDRDVDWDDWNTFARCLHGPDAPVDATCKTADLNCDGNVDLLDVRLFLLAFTG